MGKTNGYACFKRFNLSRLTVPVHQTRLKTIAVMDGQIVKLAQMKLFLGQTARKCLPERQISLCGEERACNPHLQPANSLSSLHRTSQYYCWKAVAIPYIRRKTKSHFHVFRRDNLHRLKRILEVCPRSLLALHETGRARQRVRC